MKKVYLIGFRGTGFRDARYRSEPALLRSGHVGIAFEGDEDRIIGFHPTAEAIERLGGNDSAIEHLKAGHILEGMLQEDQAIFVRAAELAAKAHEQKSGGWLSKCQMRTLNASASKQ